MMKEARANIGKSALLQTPEFQAPVLICDAKQAYGCLRYLVAPVDAKDRELGSAWVDAARVKLDKR